MATVTHLNKAPIQEAVFDFRVKLPSAFNPDVFLNLKRDALTDYPLVEPHRSIIGGFGFFEGKPIVQKPQDRKDGYVYKTNDEKNIAQFRENGFTFSRLSPYSDWDTVKKEAEKLWNLYCSIAKPETITRIALRYINRLDLTLPVKMEDFFTQPPSVPENISKDIISYTVRFVIQREELLANIIQTTIDLPEKTKIGIIFDIDTYYLDDNGINKDLWSTFEKLREFKNLIFFNSITEKTVEMYK
jgi:uncharacterized protein (TIGR04255 family)